MKIIKIRIGGERMKRSKLDHIFVRKESLRFNPCGIK